MNTRASAFRDGPPRAGGNRRRVLLGLAHLGAAQLALDEESRRAAQAAFTGCASCRDMTDGQLLAWCWELKRRGADIGIPGPRPEPARYGHPTATQWAEIERLTLAMGWADGVDSAALRGFVRRTLGLDDLRFASNRQATQVITGLRRWVASRQRRQEGRP